MVADNISIQSDCSKMTETTQNDHPWFTRYVEESPAKKRKRVEGEVHPPIPWEDGKWEPNGFVTIGDTGKSVTFQLQKGTYAKDGYNGVYPVAMLQFALGIYQSFETKDRETALLITKLQEALLWDLQRSVNRSQQGSWGHGTESKGETKK